MREYGAQNYEGRKYQTLVCKKAQESIINTTRKPSGTQSNKAEIQGRKVNFSLVGRHDRNRNMPDGKLYVAIVEDLGSRKVVGHAMSTRMTAALPLQALRNALKKRGFPQKLTLHSDQGWQYRSKVYQKELKRYGASCSMSRRGNCYDNAPMESFFATFKRELDLKKLQTREETMQAIFEFRLSKVL